MPVPTSAAPWWGSLLWLVALAASSFGIAWLSGTRLHIRKGPYIPLLLVMTAGFSVAYAMWLGVGLTTLIGNRWGWGLGVGALIGGLLIVPARRRPVDHPLSGDERMAALAWEGVVYGVAEGVLLSALPAFMAWQTVHALGWAGTVGDVAQWGLPLLATATVVIVHHLGYWNYRNRILIPVTVALTVLGAGFLVTGSWLTPAVAHIVLHGVLVLRGSEMPPQDRPLHVAPVDSSRQGLVRQPAG